MASPASVFAERTGTRTYLGKNSRGAEVKIGMGPGEFSPGELLKLALATCNTLSADQTIAATLGDDFPASVSITADYDEDADKFTAFYVHFEVPGAADLPEDKRERLVYRAERAIDSHCTIAHTLVEATPCEKTISTEK